MKDREIKTQAQAIWKAIAFVAVFSCLMTWLPPLLEDSPVSHGLTATEWLYQSRKEHDQQESGRPSNKAIIEGFDSRAIPFFIEGFYEIRQPSGGWFKRLRAFLRIPERSAPDPIELRRRCYSALVILGRGDPGQVDQFLLSQLDTTNRHEAIPWLGMLGNRHYQLLTNMVSGDNGRDADAAIRPFILSGTNVMNEIPIILTAIQNHAGTNRNFWNHIKQMGFLAHRNVPVSSGLIELLSHRSHHVQREAFGALFVAAEVDDEARVAFAKVATRPVAIVPNLGDSAAKFLHHFKIPRNVAVPILVNRIEQLVDLYHNPTNSYDRIKQCLFELAKYGPPVQEAVPFVEKLLNAMPPDPEPEYLRTGSLPPSKSWIEHQLGEIAPKWKPTDSE